ncbi:hypothetical protein ACH4LN_03905 [Streptomyces albus]|uniref:Uncharacterized protein n=1 Tax=Streptomyces albus TaxID=1888 RepID=A0A6C1CAM7_9ACTN|nr:MULTISPECIES: hypothetical protein [Streptomyces]EPD93027.1 hypothetical protein HMPREF1486_04104 [Streptomyces sp. HPH0547]QID39135.1 hypothetical protein G3260_005929 [Streptomyces albus]TGG85637.1 hypothetical protein D8771_10860 [Streptomyces albus]UVN53837.1 hypothetical protein NR995_04300 [Streptomyces albus]
MMERKPSRTHLPGAAAIRDDGPAGGRRGRGYRFRRPATARPLRGTAHGTGTATALAYWIQRHS